ncbi:fimbrillin family protein [uncultured Bacteroides sp.]|uniref:fimbrillin family protein n=1 Tax=uncultured Bacteroides sp. TaxID=162156 RepID=UPI0025F0FABE|nr:fimbrillin family protein [uncultured Bacteroides sp.]
MKKNQLIYAILFINSLFVASCSQNEEMAEVGRESNLQISITDGGVHNSTSTRATTDADYKTIFTSNDQIGLFAVKNGEIVGNISNICLTYNEEMQKWGTPTGNLPYSEELEGATYYAYYPYKLESSLDLENEAEPFGNIINNWSIDPDLSDADKYSENDLMTGSGTATKTGKDYTINLTLTHSMAMVELQLPSIVYNFSNDGIPSYSLPVTNVSFSLQEGSETINPVFPYYDPTTKKYRLLVKPNTSYTISGEFTSDVARIYEKTINIESGKYAPYTVGGGNSAIEHTLKIGDFYCSDGSLIAGDKELTDAEKDKVVGVIYNIGTTESITADYPQCSHGLVYTLKCDGNAAYWGNTSSTNAEFAGWYEGHLKTDKTDIHGYENTKYWLSIPDGLVVGRNLCAAMQKKLKEYTAAPANTTGWYIPSIKELYILRDNAEIINASLSKASGEELWLNSSTAGYWSSTIRNDVSLWQSAGGAEDLAKSTKTGGHYRYSLAF